MVTNDWLQLASTIVTAAATAVLAWFAWVQIRAEKRRRESEERAAAARREIEERTVNARLSTSAFDLRKGLADWILKTQETGWGANKEAQEAISYVERILGRFDQTLVDAAGASSAAAARMRSAYTYLRGAEVRFEGYLGEYYRATQQQLRGAELVQNADDRLLSDAREHFRACCHELEAIIEPQLVAEARRLGAWREP